MVMTLFVLTGDGVLFSSSVFTHDLVFTGSPELELMIVTVCLLSASLTTVLFYRPPGSRSYFRQSSDCSVYP